MSETSNLYTALCAFQAEAPTLPKDATNPHFRSKFTPLDTIVEQVRPLLAKHGLTWSALPTISEQGQPALRYKLVHAASGEVLQDTMPLMLAKADSQGMGAAITYARRYALSSVLNLVSDEDTDGNDNRATPKRSAPAPQRAAQSVSEPLATDDDVAAMATAVKGLTPKQIKLAFSSCNLPAPAKMDSLDDAITAFGKVPQSQAGKLARTLAGVKR